MSHTSVGFIVSRGVGNSVTRHRVTRQLRHLMRERYLRLPPGTGVVVRAMRAAAGRTSAELGSSLDRALDKTVSRAVDCVVQRDHTPAVRQAGTPQAVTP